MAYVDGELLPRSQAKVSVWDSGFQHGDSVYEGVRVYAGRVLQLEAHLQRLHASAHAIGFTPTRSVHEMAEAVMATLRANELYDNAHLRITLSRGVKMVTGMDPRLVSDRTDCLVIIAEPKEPPFRRDGVDLVTASIRRSRPDFLDPKIHSSNQLGQILAKIEANQAGADDALMLDGSGFVAETNSANFFIIKRGVLWTSRPNACLNGLTRRWLLDNSSPTCEAALETDISLTDVYTSDEAFMCGTVCEIVPVVHVDGRTIANGAPGEATLALLAAYRAYARTAGVPIPGVKADGRAATT
jgi:branched-chain amino acid aminotransferase